MKTAVIGSGLMGSGIAFVCAANGHDTVLIDIVSSQLEKAKSLHTKIMEKNVARKKWAESKREEVAARLTYAEQLSEAGSAEIVIEAVVEDYGIKEKVYRELETHCSLETILGSNTSSLPITRIASATSHPERVIGTHFFNPAHIMKLVEIIRGLLTSEECFQKTRSFVESLKKSIVVSQDFPGFITSRLGVVLMLEAVFALQEGVATKEDIDQAMQLGYNHPMGPFRLADLVGLDTLLHVSEVLYENFQDPKYRAPWLLRQMVQAGKLGQKTGEGFYTYK